MINGEIIKLRKVLFSTKDAGYYAVLSCSFDNEILTRLKDNIEHLFLSETDDFETNIFELDKESLLLELFLKEETIRNKAVILTVPRECGIEEVKDRLIPLENAVLDDGEMVKVPIYDPRFLVKYLPTCNEEDIDLLFESVLRYLIWDRDNVNNLLFFEGNNGKVESRLLEL